jgi:TolB-like protein
MLGAAAALALPAVLPAQSGGADNRPIVVVFTFDNNSIGKDRGDYDNLSKGIQDLLITDLASNAKIRLVDRARIQELSQEQNLVKSGAVDPQTAIQIGKMLGAQYAITGGFLADTRSGNTVLTGRTIDMETSQISNPQKINGKADDVLGIIAQLSSKLSSGMNLTPKAPRRVGSTGGAGDTGSGTGTKQAGKQVETFAKAVSDNSRKAKLDAATFKVYSDACDAMDKKNTAKATTLFRQVLAKYPDFEQAKNNLSKLQGAGD